MRTLILRRLSVQPDINHLRELGVVMNLRCSSLPLIEKCPAASRTPSVVMVSGGEEAELGNAAHEALACYVRGWKPDLDELAERYEVDRDDLGYIVQSGRQVWEKVAQHFPSPSTEVPLEAYWLDENLLLTGHIDVLSVSGERAHVWDWKTGYLDEDHSGQMKGYALLVLENYPRVNDVYCGVGRVRDGTVDGQVYNREQIETWWAKVVESVQGPETFSTGRWCGHCPRGHECPSFATSLAQGVRSLMERSADEVTDAEQLVQLYDRAKLVQAACERAMEIVRAGVELLGGRAPAGDGRELVMGQQKKTIIDFDRGNGVIQDAIGPAGMARCVQVVKGKLEEEIGKVAERRQKGKAIQAVMERLEEAGALTVEYSPRLERKQHATITTTTSGNGAQRQLAGEPAGAGD